MKSLKYTWLNLFLAPSWFLLVIMAGSIYFVGQGISEIAIPTKITQNIPTLLLVVQILLLITLYWSSKKDTFNLFTQGWTVSNKSDVYKDSIYGILTGISLAILYIVVLSPFQTFLQQTIGDYVPAGETFSQLGQQLVPFFIANVLLAPFVEESIYRNYTLTRLLENYSLTKVIIINSVFFGLLHWMGGFWYILLTGIVIGIPFAVIATKKKNIVWVFAAHLTLNLIEFIHIARSV